MSVEAQIQRLLMVDIEGIRDEIIMTKLKGLLKSSAYIRHIC